MQTSPSEGSRCAVPGGDGPFEQLETIIAIVNEVGQVLGHLPFVQPLGKVIVQFVKIRNEIKTNRERCQEVIDKVLRKSQMIYERLLEVGQSPNRDKLQRLENTLIDYERTLRTVYKVLQSNTTSMSRSFLRTITDRGTDEINRCDRQVDSIHSDIILDILMEIRIEQVGSPARSEYPVSISGPPSPWSRSTPIVFAHTLPPKPRLMVERDAVVNNMINMLLGGNPSRIAILGEQGFGKTTCSLFALHDSRIARRFTNRFYLSCESMTNARSLLVGIAHMLGIASNKSCANLIPFIRQFLQGTTTLICLDNFESPWEELSTRQKVEDALVSILAIENLSLIVNVRGKERPFSVDWTWPPFLPLQQISISGAESTVRGIAGIQAVDQYTRILLQSLEGIPLAIILVSNLLRNGAETSSSLWRRWCYEEQRQDSQMDAVLDGENMQISKIDVAIAISIDSPQVQGHIQDARNILATLSLLPNGFSSDDKQLLQLQTLLKANNLHECLHTLRNLGLLRIDEVVIPHRIRVIYPVGIYCQKSFASEVSAVCVELTNYYINKVTEIGAPTSTPNPEHKTEMELEIRNIYSLFRRRYTSKNILDITLAKFVRASYLLGLWSIHMGYMLDDILGLAFGSSAMLPTPHARCRSDHSITYCEMGQFEGAEELSALTSTFVSRTWPAFSGPTTSPRDVGLPDARTALFTAALGLSLARMSILEALTVPASDAALLARQSAFVRALTSMGEVEAGALFAWLAGPTNDVCPRLPNLVDGRFTGSPRRVRSSPQPFRAAAARRLSVLSSRVVTSSALGAQLSTATPPAQAVLLTPPLGSAASPTTLSISAPSPNANLHAPLASLTINLSTTLYAGLRPASLMATLRGGPTHLTLRVARAVDRRTIEKVVGVVGAALGSREDSVGGIEGAMEGSRDGVAAAEGGQQVGSKEKGWEGTGLLPFTMPMRPRVAESPPPTKATSATKSGMVARGAVVRDEDDNEEDPDYVKLDPAPAELRSRAINRATKSKMVTRTTLVRDKESDSDEAVAAESIQTNTTKTAIEKAPHHRPMVARPPLVRDEDEEEEEEEVALEATMLSPNLANVKVRTMSAATKSGMVARGPVVRDEDEDEEPETVELASTPVELWAKTVSTATRAMVPRSPVVRDEDEEEPPADAKFTPVEAKDQGLTFSKRDWSSKPMVARAPVVRYEDDEDGVPLKTFLLCSEGPDDASVLCISNEVSSRRARAGSSASQSSAPTRNVRKTPVKLMIARQPLSRNFDENEPETTSPSSAAPTFRSGADSTSSQSSVPSSYGRSSVVKPMVARAPVVRDEDEDEDEEQEVLLEEDKTSSNAEVPWHRTVDTGAKSVQSVFGKSMAACAPLVLDQAKNVTEEPEDSKLAPVAEDPQGRTRNITDTTSLFRQHRRNLSAKFKAMVARVARIEEDDAAPLSQSAAENAAGPQWDGLVSLEVAFDDQDSDNSGREEAVYRSLSASLARHKALTSLNLHILPREFDSTNAVAEDSSIAHREPSIKEQELLHLWVDLCPTLQSITFFSGAMWNSARQPPKGQSV